MRGWLFEIGYWVLTKFSQIYLTLARRSPHGSLPSNLNAPLNPGFTPETQVPFVNSSSTTSHSNADIVLENWLMAYKPHSTVFTGSDFTGPDFSEPNFSDAMIEETDHLNPPSESTPPLESQPDAESPTSAPIPPDPVLGDATFRIVTGEDGAISVQVRGETMSLATALESLLFVAETAVETGQFVKIFSLPAEVIEAELTKLGERFQSEQRGIRLQVQKGRYRLISAPAASNLIETFLNLDLSTRLSGPALESLSVIAYRQPVTRAQIEAVRGVDCGHVLRSLLQRGLIEESGRLETIGRPILYSVTEQFMHHFGLTTLNELPPLETTEAALLKQVTEVES